MLTRVRRTAILFASIALAACSSGTVIVVRRPVPPPPPPRPRIEPLEITVARPVRGHLLVQTNRPSYVALFEIVPDRGVALLAPTYAHQRTWMLAGLNWVPVSWKVQSTMYYGPPAGTAVPARWVYAIASDEPLRLPDEAFHPAYMRRVLGPAAYRGTNPYVTMRAIARAFVPSVIDEAWAEDAYALAATYASDPYRTVRIYCANRTVYEVPEEMADRAWCPVHGPSRGTVVQSTPTRPDSIVATNGQRVRRRMPETTPVRTPIDRVSEPPRSENAPVTTDHTPPRSDTVKDAKDATKDRRGNAYGHTDDPNVKGRGIENEKQKAVKDTPADTHVQDLRRQPRIETPPSNNPPSHPEKTDVKQDKQEEKQVRREEKQEEKQIRQEQKQEETQLRQVEKQEEKQIRQEEKQEEKPPKAEEKPEQKAEKQAVTIEPPRQPDVPAPKPDAKPDTKDEKSDAKSETKADEKSTGKPEEKPHGKPDADPPGKKDHKGKP